MKTTRFAALALSVALSVGCGDDDLVGLRTDGGLDAAVDGPATIDGAGGVDTGATADARAVDAGAVDAAAVDGARADASPMANADRPPMPDVGAIAGARYFVYAGSNLGIDVLHMDPATGKLTPRTWIEADPAMGFLNASYITADPAGRNLYVVSNNSGRQSRLLVFAIDAMTGGLSLQKAVDTGGQQAVHVSLERAPMPRFAFVSHFSPGDVLAGHNVAVFSLAPGKVGEMIGTPYPTCANPHAVYPDQTGQLVFVPCYGSELVYQFKLDTNGKLTRSGETPVAGTRPAPRHMDFIVQGGGGAQKAYLLNELSQTINVYSVDIFVGTLALAQEGVRALPETVKPDNTNMLRGRSAEIFAHPKGTFVYASTRLDAWDATGRRWDSAKLPGYLAAYPVIASGDAKAGQLDTTKGQFTQTVIEPRGFAMDPQGKYLVAASSTGQTDNLVSYSINETTGALTEASKVTTAAAAWSPTGHRTDIAAIVYFAQ